MGWTTKAGERPPDVKPAKAEELPYPPAITPDRKGASKPKPSPRAKPAGKR